MSEFAGEGRPLSEIGVQQATEQLGVQPLELWTVLRVETSGCGLLPDRRPKILFERHVFHRETNGEFDAVAPDISNKERGGYGAGGAHQYERLNKAIALDRAAALRSASWGIGQVMGYNANAAGFASVDAMVEAMKRGEDEQLRGVTGFIAAHDIAAALSQHNWKAFALVYNGPACEEQGYPTNLQKAFERYSERGLPDLRVRAAQVYLTYRGLDPGPVDGEMGGRTRNALQQFQQQASRPVTGELDDATLAALQVS